MTLYDSRILQNFFEIGRFAQAAKRAAIIAEFDAIEIHNAHGYLLHQFLSPMSNHRNDRYGGCLQNRCRMSLEVARAVRKVIPDHMPLIFRVSAVDWFLTSDSWSLQNTVWLSKHLKKCGVDSIHVSSGGIRPDYAVQKCLGDHLEFSRTIRSQALMPTIAVGDITELAMANEVIEEEFADLVAVGRAHLRDASWLRSTSAAAIGCPFYVPPHLRMGYTNTLQHPKRTFDDAGSSEGEEATTNTSSTVWPA